MYKLIIVDDEYTIRRGLQQYIPWFDLGFEVVGAFADGLSALDFLSNHPVDVLLTDINMPIMNGIKLIQLVRERGLSMKCVVISGYNDFNYAKQLLSCELTDYVLKPLDNDQIAVLFSTLKDSLDKQYLKQKHALDEKRKIEAMRHTLKQQFFSDIFLKRVSRTNSSDYLERYGLDMDTVNQHILYSKLHIDNTNSLLHDSWHYGIDALYDSIVNYLKNLATDFQLTDFPEGQDTIHIVALSTQDNDLELSIESYKKMLDAAIQWIESISSIKISIVTLKSYESLDSVDQSNSSEIMPSNICLQPTLHTTNSTPPPKKSVIELSAGTELTYFYNAINSAFLERNMEQVYERVDTLYDTIKHYLSDDARIIYQSILKILFRQFDDMDTLATYYSTGLMACTNIHDMNVHTKQCIEYLSKELSANSDGQLERLMKQALLFIEEHYQEDISRNDVADYVFLSSSYFSRCFKRVVGVKFIDHLTKLRIQKSCELLMDCNNKISDVCEQVGYNSPSYFTRVFKCTMGVTPNEYIRANILQ
ncbi:MAG: response regulator [Eubacteriales bacterium]